MFSILFVSSFYLIVVNAEQWKPFGSSGVSKSIEERDQKYPIASEFFTNYISNSEPLLSRQVLLDDPHYSIWQTDEQLENEVDDLAKVKVYVEAIKQQQRVQMKFGDFLENYQKDDLFLADNLPEILHKYIVVPGPFQCESVFPTLQSISLIMNSMSASPLIFNEEFDPFLCLFRGNKQVVLVNTHKYPDVRQYVFPKNRQRLVNPDRVDLNQFPALANIDYHIANLSAGDCLLIPSGWIFQERSNESSISIIYNIDHKQAVNVDRNAVQSCKTYDSSFTLEQIDWSQTDNGPRNLKEVMMNLINSKSNRFEKWQETFSKFFSFDLGSDPETSAIFDEFYGIIDVNGDGEITAAEVEQINGVHQHHISDILYELARAANEKQTMSSSNEMPAEDVNEEIENDDLHSENYRTDL